MKLIGSVASGFGLGKAVVGLFSGGKKKMQPLPSPTSDDAETLIADELRRRRGGQADVLFGASGTEAGAGATGKAALGQ